MILVVDFICPPTNHFGFVVECGGVVARCDSVFCCGVRKLFYFGVRQVLLQNATGAAECDGFVAAVCDRCCRVRKNSASLKKGFNAT